jgi:RNA polymerase sigma-70 factor (ECF subfamily)
MGFADQRRVADVIERMRATANRLEDGQVGLRLAHLIIDQQGRLGAKLATGVEDHLPHSHRLPAVRGELLSRAGDRDGARAAYGAALELCGNEAERALLATRRKALDAAAHPPVESPGDP